MNIFSKMHGKSFEEQVRAYRQWMKDVPYGHWHMTPDEKASYDNWINSVAANSICDERDRQEQEEFDNANKEYNANKDSIHGPYAGGRQW
jgi:hypothetical protein